MQDLLANPVTYITILSYKPVARNFYWGFFWTKCRPFWQNSGPFLQVWAFLQNREYFKQNYGFLNKIVDLFNKIVDLLFREGVLQHLENPPGYGPELCMWLWIAIITV